MIMHFCLILFTNFLNCSYLLFFLMNKLTQQILYILINILFFLNNMRAVFEKISRFFPALHLAHSVCTDILHVGVNLGGSNAEISE